MTSPIQIYDFGWGYDVLDKGSRDKVASALSSAINLYRDENHQKAPE